MMLMSYIAFKALRVQQGSELYSPKRGTKWELVYDPALGRLIYSLRTSSLEVGEGIYAADLREAAKYCKESCDIFLAVPHPDAEETEIGTKGWRTTWACVAGKVTSLRAVADLILASHQAGYPQIEAILKWASCPSTNPPPIDYRRVPALSPAALATLVPQMAEIIRYAAKENCQLPITVVDGDKPPKVQRTRIVVGKGWPVLALMAKEVSRQ